MEIEFIIIPLTEPNTIKMKPIIKFLVVCFITSMILSCNDPAKKEDLTDNKAGDTYLTGGANDTTTISHGKFDTMRTTWKENFRAYMQHDSLHYFEMPIADLKAVLNEINVDDTRFYLGMDIKGRDTFPHIMLVGMKNGQPDWSIIGDYSKACPPICN